MRPALASSAGRTEVLGESTGAATTVTGGASNAKGAFATLGTSSFAYAGIAVFAQNGVRRGRLDIGVNNGGADEVIVEDFPFTAAGNPTNGIATVLPVQIPAGAVVKARAQVQAASNPLVCLTGFSGGFGGTPGRGIIKSATDWNASSPGVDPANVATLSGTAGTNTAWTTLMASTPKRFIYLWFGPASSGDTSRTAGTLFLEIGVGAAASEQTLFTAQFQNATSDFYGNLIVGFACDIPAGSRLAYRARHSTTATDSIGAVAMGLAA